MPNSARKWANVFIIVLAGFFAGVCFAGAVYGQQPVLAPPCDGYVVIEKANRYKAEIDCPNDFYSKDVTWHSRSNQSR
jgi:hypothetical protein